MDFMANLYFASKADTDGAVIFIDEGFFHRGVSFFFQKKRQRNSRNIWMGLPHAMFWLCLKPLLKQLLSVALIAVEPQRYTQANQMPRL